MVDSGSVTTGTGFVTTGTGSVTTVTGTDAVTSVFCAVCGVLQPDSSRKNRMKRTVFFIAYSQSAGFL
jgi:hypothetical protein